MDKSNALRRSDFPELTRRIGDQPLTYLDSAATSLMPTPVLKVLQAFYATNYANVHRSVSTLGYEATNRYEEARQQVARWLHAGSDEIIFTAGCTDSLNLVAATWGRQHLHAGDEVVVSIMEHHSSLLPWQQLALQVGAKLRFIQLTPAGTLDLEQARTLFNAHTKVLVLTQVSNVLGCENPVGQLAKWAHAVGAIAVIDGAQAVPHLAVNVAALDCDFYAFSGHKLLAPTGIGVLYGKRVLLQQLPPYRYGGEMIADVSCETASWADGVQKFEAGTPNIIGAIGLAAALTYLTKIGWQRIWQHDQVLLQDLATRLAAIPGVTLYGSGPRYGVISFNLAGVHPHDLATVLDQLGVEVRAGHHCAEPLVHALGTESTVRASVFLYNDQTDCDRLISGIKTAKEFFHVT